MRKKEKKRNKERERASLAKENTGESSKRRNNVYECPFNVHNVHNEEGRGKEICMSGDCIYMDFPV